MIDKCYIEMIVRSQFETRERIDLKWETYKSLNENIDDFTVPLKTDVNKNIVYTLVFNNSKEFRTIEDKVDVNCIRVGILYS